MKVLNNVFPDKTIELLFDGYDFNKFDTDVIRKSIDEIDDLAGKIIYLEWLKKEADELLRLSNDKIINTLGNRYNFRLLYIFKNKISVKNENKLKRYVNNGFTRIVKVENDKQEMLSKIKMSIPHNTNISETKNKNIISDVLSPINKAIEDKHEVKSIMAGMQKILNLKIAQWEDKNSLDVGCSINLYGDDEKYTMMNIIMEDVTKYIDENIDFWKNRLLLQKQNVIVKEVITKSGDKKSDIPGISKVQWRGEDTDLYYTLNELEKTGFLTTIDKENFLNIIELYFLDKKGKSFGDKRTTQGFNNLLDNKDNKSKNAFKIDAILDKTQKPTKIKKDK